MNASHDFLTRLGLQDDADARAVRRAYARELKQVDQERDPAAFQHLRDCYETALEWAAWKLREEQQGEGSPVPEPTAAPESAPAPAPMPAPAPGPVSLDKPPGAGAQPEPAPPGPRELGRMVFEAFCERIPGLIDKPVEPRDKPWIAALRDALDDERLLNLEARYFFEMHVAWALAKGWRPGHEILFPAAAEVFGWDQDRRATARLGEAGEMLHAAIEQRLSFRSQNLQVRQRQREVLALLRQGEPPSDKRIMAGMATLEQLVQRFPQWLPVIAPVGNVGYWRDRYKAAKGKPFEIEESPPPQARRAWKWHFQYWQAALVLAAIALLKGMFNSPPAPAGFYPPADQVQHETAEQERYRLAHPKPLYVDEKPARERLDEIGARIDYKLPPDAKPGVLKADFEVFLDADGAILGANKKKGSGVPAFDAAVLKAIRETRPFPPKTAKVFGVSYSVNITRVTKKPAAPFHQKAPWENTGAEPAPKGGAPAWPPAPSPRPLADDAPRDGQP